MRKLIAALLFTSSFLAFAQEESIITDRPTQSASAFVVPAGSILLETGSLSEMVTDGVNNFTFLNVMARWGVMEGVELRVTQNYVGNNILDERESGLSPLTLGTKVHLVAEDGAKPQMSIIGQVTLETGSEEFKPDETTGEVRLNFQNTLSEKLSLGYNAGMVLANEELFIYSVVLGFSVVEGVSIFAEPYGFLGGDDGDHRFNAGIIYLTRPNLQFDFSFGAGLSDNSPDSFVGFGVAFGF